MSLWKDKLVHFLILSLISSTDQSQVVFYHALKMFLLAMIHVIRYASIIRYHTISLSFIPSSLLLVQLLECGSHRCSRLCHSGGCGRCLQMSVKVCRCGKKTKSVLCSQEFLCETKCTTMRQCGRHQCKRKVRGRIHVFIHQLPYVVFVLFSAVVESVHLVSRSVVALSAAGIINARHHVTKVFII